MTNGYTDSQLIIVPKSLDIIMTITCSTNVLCCLQVNIALISPRILTKLGNTASVC